MSKSVYVENNAHEYKQMFISNGWTIAASLEHADLLQLIGGADVNPALYGEQALPNTWFDDKCDEHTKLLTDEAIRKRIPIAGICRGSQYLSVLGGGKLWQDVDGHATGYSHDLLDIESDMIIEGCSSTHHQQHRPASSAIIIATSFNQLSTYKSTAKGNYKVKGHSDDMTLEKDIEAFYYKHINALGYQPHPEFFNADHPCQMYYFDLIAIYLGLKTKE